MAVTVWHSKLITNVINKFEIKNYEYIKYKLIILTVKRNACDIKERKIKKKNKIIQ